MLPALTVPPAPDEVMVEPDVVNVVEAAVMPVTLFVLVAMAPAELVA
jgi:hypothetical protein